MSWILGAVWFRLRQEGKLALLHEVKLLAKLTKLATLRPRYKYSQAWI